MRRKRRPKRDELQFVILRIMRTGGARRQRYLQPWTPAELLARAPVAHLAGRDVSRIREALAALEKKGHIRQAPGLPVAYTLEA